MVSPEVLQTNITASRKRRLRRKRLHVARTKQNIVNNSQDIVPNSFNKELNCIKQNTVPKLLSIEKGSDTDINRLLQNFAKNQPEMSSNESTKTRDDVVAAREAKKLAKQKGKSKGSLAQDKVTESTQKDIKQEQTNKEIPKTEVKPDKSKDEVDRAIIKEEPKIGSVVKSKEEIKAERTAKKAAKQSKKKKEDETGDSPPNSDMTMKDVVETLKDIVNVAKEVQDVTAKVQAINLEPSKKVGSAKRKPQAEDGINNADTEGSGKSKAELKAERRAKQEAQRAAKQAPTQQKVVAAAPVVAAKAKIENTLKAKEERPPKAKSVEKSKLKTQSVNRVNWFQHLHKQQDKEDLKKIPINSNLHPAIIKLGVQLASRVVTGSNARCIALLDALKKMVKDYTLPAKTEFARGLEAHLAAHLEFLWARRQPSASQTNAVKFFRHHLTQLPNNVDEFDAKKTLQEEIDRYIREQIDMAGEAISLAVRNKICDGDNILTYGCSSLIERILVEAWEAGVRFRAVVVGARVGGSGAREMLRRLVARALPAQYIDITALSYVMPTMNKVILGASSLLVNGSVLGAAGTAQAALAARACNVPVLVACETHKVSERVQTDAFVYNEIGDPDELVDNDADRAGESPLKDWRSNPHLTPLNLTYDVTPPSLVSAVVTELAILPCTSAPVVLRFKLSEYGIQG